VNGVKVKEDGWRVLEVLKTDMSNKSGTMLIRTLYDRIEASLASGVTREIILKHLNETYERNMSLQTFDKNLYRIRKEIKKNKASDKDFPNQISIVNTGNQIVPYHHQETKNSNIVVIEEINSKDLSNEGEDDGYEYKDPEGTELEFMRKLHAPPDYIALNEMKRKYDEERREKKKREREQAKLKNQPN
jgi:hypothetical protein